MGVSDGRAALELRGSCRDLLSAQAQVVMRRLHAERSARLTGRPHQLQRAGGRQVHDVAAYPAAHSRGQAGGAAEQGYFTSEMLESLASPVLEAELRHQADGLHLHGIRPGLQEGGVLAGVSTGAGEKMFTHYLQHRHTPGHTLDLV